MYKEAFRMTLEYFYADKQELDRSLAEGRTTPLQHALDMDAEERELYKAITGEELG